MKQGTLLIWDGWVYGTGSKNTPHQFDEPLGMFDLVSLKAVVTEVDATGSISIGLYHSGDGVNYASKSGSDEIIGAVTTGAVNVLFGADTSGMPSLHLVRAELALAGLTRKAHVKLYATLRDRGKRRVPKTERHRRA